MTLYEYLREQTEEILADVLQVVDEAYDLSYSEAQCRAISWTT